MTEEYTIDNSLIKTLASIKNDILESGLGSTPEQEKKMQEIRQEVGMSEDLAEYMSYYFSQRALIDLALNPRNIPIEMREPEAKFERLIEWADELFIAFYKREKNKCDSFLTEIEVAFDSTELRIMILSNIYDEGCELYARYFP